MRVYNTAGNNRRAHVHRDVGVLPDFSGLPLAVLFGECESVCALPGAVSDQVSAGPERRRDVLVPLVGKRRRPQFFAALRVEADNQLLRQGNDLRLLADLDDERGRVTWSNSAPLPLRRAARGIQAENLAAVNVAADLDYQTSIYCEWRCGCAVEELARIDRRREVSRP